MSGLLVAIVSAFGVVFVAELGDKTQLLALGYGSRYSLRTVVIGLALGYAAAGAIASAVGGVLGATLPERPVALVGGLLFLVFAVMTVLDCDGDDGDDGGHDDGEAAAPASLPAVNTRRVVASIALTIAVAEMGDKTQLATATLAARANPFGTWIGATVGEVAAGMVGAIAGQRVGTRISPRTLRWASAVLFAGFGVLLLITAW